MLLHASMAASQQAGEMLCSQCCRWAGSGLAQQAQALASLARGELTRPSQESTPCPRPALGCPGQHPPDGAQ